MAAQEPASTEGARRRRPRVLLAASGSVAAIKFEVLCRSVAEWADVRAVATASALHFIDGASLGRKAQHFELENLRVGL